MTAAILFDFNGVIVDDEAQHCEALIATLGEDGFALDQDTYYREYLGFDDRECFRFSYARMGRATDEPTLRQAVERKSTHYERAIRNSLRLVPGAEDFIESAALDLLPSGIGIFGTDFRLVYANRSFRDLRFLPERLCIPGTPLEDIVRHIMPRLYAVGARGIVEYPINKIIL